MRCLSVLDLVILFYLFIFFLGREAQKVLLRGVCLSWIWSFYFIIFFLGREAVREFFKNVDFSVTYPLKGV